MAAQIIKTDAPVPECLKALGMPTAQRLLAWEQAQADALLADVFGYHALQAGWMGFDALRANRMPHRWLALQEFDADNFQALTGNAGRGALRFDSRAWPWPEQSLDLVVLPHTLERSRDPHACLREVERVLIAEGHVLITGINPWSGWGHTLRRSQRRLAPGEDAAALMQPIAPHRLRDWLQLLGFQVQAQHFFGWTPCWRNERWVQRWQWMDAVGQRWLPFLGGAYALLATKRVLGGRVVSDRAWRQLPSRAAQVAPAASAGVSVGVSAGVSTGISNAVQCYDRCLTPTPPPTKACFDLIRTFANR